MYEMKLFTKVGLKNIKYNSKEIFYINFIIYLDYYSNSFIIIDILFSISCIIFVLSNLIIKKKIQII